MTFFLSSNKKIYFASDLHLTSTFDKESREREKKFVAWLETIKTDAAAVFLLGDIFDFWFEYRHAIPRGHTRLMGKLAEMTDNGIHVFFFTGNHDQWMHNYLSEELMIKVYHKPTEFEINGKLFLIGHGHYIILNSFRKRMLNYVFGNSLLRKLFSAIHPRWGIALGKNWSISNRKKKGIVDPFEDLDKEPIYLYVLQQLTIKHYDYFVFGHRHMTFDVRLNENSRYINTGEWIQGQTYAVFSGENIEIAKYNET